MKRKALSIFLASAMSLSLLAGCGGAADTASTTTDNTTDNTAEAPAQDPPKESTNKEPKASTYEITKSMIDQGMSPKQIATERGLKISTIYGHLSRYIEQDYFDASQFVSEDHYDTIRDYFQETEDPALGTAKEVLGDKYDYGEIKMVLAELKRDGMFS